MWLLSYKIGFRHTRVQRGDHVRTQEEMTVYKRRRGASGETTPTNASILDS